MMSLSNPIDVNEVYNNCGFFIYKKNDHYLIAYSSDIEAHTITVLEVVHGWGPFEYKRVSPEELSCIKVNLVSTLDVSKDVNLDFSKVTASDEIINLISKSIAREFPYLKDEKILELKLSDTEINLSIYFNGSKFIMDLLHDDIIGWYVNHCHKESWFINDF